MTVAELIDMVRVLGGPEITPGAMLQALNVAQDDVSRNLRIPINTVDFQNITSPSDTTWPVDAREEGIMAVYALTLSAEGEPTASKRIPIYDFHTASQYDPSWTFEKPAPLANYIVWDPTYGISFPLLVPPPSEDNPQSIRVTYVARPDKMTELNDKPFHGKLASFHDILAYRAAWLLTRDRSMKEAYDERMREAAGASNHGAVVAKNPLYRRNVVSNRRG